MLKKILFTIMFMVMISSVSADGYTISHWFSGDVTTNGHPAVDGVWITAYVDESLANCDEPLNGMCQVQAGITKNGRYGDAPDLFKVASQTVAYNRIGAQVTFYVGDVEATTFNYITPTEFSNLDLSVTGDFPAPEVIPDTNNDNDGGSSKKKSSSSGGAVPRTTADNETNTTVEPEEELETETAQEGFDTAANTCESNWVCSDWLDCVNGQEKRVCVDANQCDSDDAKPDITRVCDLPKLEESNFFNKITGAVVGGGVGTWISLAIIILIIGAGVWFGSRHKKK